MTNSRKHCISKQLYKGIFADVSLHFVSLTYEFSHRKHLHAIYKLTSKGKKNLLNLVKSSIFSLLAFITSQLLAIKTEKRLGWQKR